MTRELFLQINAESNTPLYQQVYFQIRKSIVEGSLQCGNRLPSIRKLAETLSLSHTTIEQAYLQLSVEGYVRNVPRSGYVVEALDTDFLRMPKPHNIEESVKRSIQDRSSDSFATENLQGRQALYDFSYANLPAESFPANTWRKTVNDILFGEHAPELTRYTNTKDASHIQEQLANYLARVRGVNCVAEQLVLQAGTEGALTCILELFDPTQHTIGIEEPGYPTVIEVAKRMGFHLVPIPSNKKPADFLRALHQHKPKIVFCTPSHQFPTGGVMHLDTRTHLLKWAQEHKAYIIEDDSCNEYRYDTAPIPSLQSLDAYQRVIYLCNVSKVLSPSLRIAYMVLPPKLLGRYLRLFNFSHPSISFIEAEVLARFIEEGLWDAHVRRMAHSMRKRHDILLSCLESTFGSHAEISGKHAGMHLYVGIHNKMTQEELIATAAAEGAAVYGTKRMWFSHRKPEQNIMIGFSAIEPDLIPEGVSALARAWL